MLECQQDSETIVGGGLNQLIQFTKNLKQIREAHGLSRQELADMSNISSAAIGYYETGKREPQASTLVSIAAALHISVDDLLGYHVDLYERAEHMLQGVGITTTHDADGISLHIPADAYERLDKGMFIENLILHATAGQGQALDVVIPTDTFRAFVDKASEEANTNADKTFLSVLLVGVQQYQHYKDMLIAYQKGQPLTPFLGHDSFPTGKEPDKADRQRADQANKKAADPKADGDKKD